MNEERIYDSGDKMLAAEVKVFRDLSPRYFHSVFIGWTVYEGWSFKNESLDDHWFWGWHGEDVTMSAKIDAYVTGSSEFQWAWKWCHNCDELKYTKIVNSYPIGTNPSDLPGWTFRFDPLIWYVAKITNITDEDLFYMPNCTPLVTGDCDCDDGDQWNQDKNPELCGNCWN